MVRQSLINSENGIKRGVMVLVDRLDLLPYESELCWQNQKSECFFVLKSSLSRDCSPSYSLPISLSKDKTIEETPGLTAWDCVFLLEGSRIFNIFLVLSESSSSFFWLFRKVLSTPDDTI